MSKSIKVSKRVIGIDIHPRCFAAAALTINKKQLWLHSRVEMVDLDKWLEKNILPGDILVLESGSNSFFFAEKVAACDAECIVLDSVKVGKISKSYLKTDKEDAVKIAKVYLSGLAEEVWKPDLKTVLRRQVLSKYVQTNKTINKTKNMIKSFLVENGVNFPKGKKVYSKEGKAWVLSLKEFEMTQKLLVGLMYDDLEHALKNKKTLAKIMAQDLLTDDNAMGLIKLCGIRTICAFALVAAAGDIKRFPSPKKFAAYLGLVPSVQQSGDNKRYGGIGKTGRKETRTFLVQGAQAVLKSSDDYGGGFKQWGIKLAVRKGRNVAVSGLARKMAIAAWYQMNGHKTNIHIPERNLNVKIQKISVEIGKDVLKEIGYETPMEFRLKMKEKLVEVA
jgi:transposase